MQIVWVVEQHKVRHSAALDLMGDFAVRRIASIESLLRLAKCDKRCIPDIVLLNTSELIAADLKQIEQTFRNSKILLTEEVPQAETLGPRYIRVSLPLMPLEFVRFVVTSKDVSVQRTRAIYRFNDLELNVANHSLRVLTSEQSVTLTKKETQILRTFFERPGACIDRDTLLKEVWNGVRVTDRSIDSQICRIRKMIEHYGLSISSIYGQGYVLA